MVYFLMLIGFSAANSAIVASMDGMSESVFSGAILGIAYLAAYVLGKTDN